MRKLTDPKKIPSQPHKPTIIINLKRKKKQDAKEERNDKSVLENRFDDLLTICKSISQDTPQDIANSLFCHEEFGDYVATSRERGVKSSRSYRLDLPEIREIEEQNDEERKSFALTERTAKNHFKREEMSTAVPTDSHVLTKSKSSQKYGRLENSRPLCSSFSVSECLMNYGLPTSKLSPNKFHQVSLTKTTTSKPKPIKIDVNKLLRSHKTACKSRYTNENLRQTQSSLGYYSRTCL